MAGAENRPVPKDETVRRNMERQRRRDTDCELMLRKALHAAGFRFRVNYPVPERPRRTIDIAFTRQRLAIFVDGCFWHGCEEHGVQPKHNAEWWSSKLAANRERDAETTALLVAAGWRVLRLWEHQSVNEQFTLVEQALADGGSAPQLQDLADQAQSSSEAPHNDNESAPTILDSSHRTNPFTGR